MKAMLLPIAAASLIGVVGRPGLVLADALTPALVSAVSCDVPVGRATVNDGFPGRMSSLVGADLRTGGHGCFERVVFELQGDGDLPGYQVRYEPDPILESPSGEPVDIAGAATLVLSVGVWTTTMEGAGYSGPTEFVPGNVRSILEVELIENFEGQSAWAIGLDQERDFRVFPLFDPVRIVIDIATPSASEPAPGVTLPPTR
jgi:hypothetical protein